MASNDHMAKQIRLGALILIAFSVVLSRPCAFASEPASESAHDLVKDVVYNELQDRVHQSFWEYRIERRIGQQSLTEEQVETRYGSIYRVIANNGVPLDQTEQQQEDARLQSLLHNPGQQQKANQQHEQDEQRLERLLALLPDAFLCEYDGQDGGDIRLNFRPNPSFKPQTYEARIFHGLAGQMWIDPQNKRLVALKGKLIERVEFGYGLLGHINEGGTFAIHRQRVSPTDWKTDLIDIHVSGRVLLFKTVNKEQHEVRSGFRAVPETLTLEQAQALLKESTVTSQLEHGQSFCCGGVQAPDTQPHKPPIQQSPEASDREDVRTSHSAH
jgi:hypothetical protein